MFKIQINTNNGWADLYFTKQDNSQIKYEPWELEVASNYSLAEFDSVEEAQEEVKEIASHGDFIVNDFRIVDSVFEGEVNP